MTLTGQLFRICRREVHVKSWALPFAPGGTLKVRLPKPCAITVYSLDPHKHDWQTAHVELHVDGETDDAFVDEETAKQVAEAFQLRVASHREPGRNSLHVETAPDTTPTALARAVHAARRWIGGPVRGGDRPVFDSRVALRVGVPGRLDVDAEVATGGPLALRGTIEGDVRVRTASADVVVEKLKSMHVDIDADDADVAASVVQGTLHVRSAAGNVDVGRAQGPAVKIDTASGDVQVRAVYAQHAVLRSREGTVRLGAAHGDTTVRTVQGDVEVAGVEGRLDVETDAGDVEAVLSAPKVVTLRSRNGDIKLGLPEALRASVLFEGGSSLEVSDEVPLLRDENQATEARRGVVSGFVGERPGENDDEGASVHAQAPSGDLSVSQQSWGASLGLGVGDADTRGSSFPRWVGTG